MLVEGNHIWLGEDFSSDTAVFHISEAALTPHDDTEAVDPSTFTDHWHWKADFAAGSYTLRDVDQETDLLTFEHGSAVTVGTDLELNGSLGGVTITDTVLRLSAFANGATNVTVRATDSDIDEIFEFDRNADSDYNMYLHRGGSRSEIMTDSHDILREGDNPYAAVADSGSVILSGPSELNFGTDLGVTDDTDNTVTIDFTGGDIPAPVDDDGTEVLANADGLDFLDYLDVADRGDNYATITVNDSNLATLDSAETITGGWAHDGSLTINDPATSDSWDLTADNGEFRLTEVGVGHHIRADLAGGTTEILNNSVAVPDGTITQQGNAVATEPWVGSELTAYTQAAASETITSEWTHQSNIALTADNKLEFGTDVWQMWHSTSNADLYVDEVSSGTATTIMRLMADGVNFPVGLSSGGDTVATEPQLNSHTGNTSNPHAVGLEQARTQNSTLGGNVTLNGSLTVSTGVTINGETSATQTWVDNNYSNYDDANAISAINNDTDHGSTAQHDYYTNSDARSAVDGANVDIAGDADSVDGFDVYVQSSEPSTSDPYIRFEPQ